MYYILLIINSVKGGSALHTIKRIEIQYFRSIYNIVIKDFSGLNMLSGKNDAGKSNVLKALNLFLIIKLIQKRSLFFLKISIYYAFSK